MEQNLVIGADGESERGGQAMDKEVSLREINVERDQRTAHEMVRKMGRIGLR